MTVGPAKTPISLGMRPVWSESSLCAQRVAKDTSILHTDSEDSDQTGQMPRLIWVFLGHTVILLILSWGSSFLNFWPIKLIDHILFHNNYRGFVFAEYCLCSIIKGFGIIMNIGNINLIQNGGFFGYKTTSSQGICFIYHTVSLEQ